MSIRIPLRCSAENRVIGVLTGSPGARIDEQALRSGYEAADGYAADLGSVKDGVQMLCPRCKNPLVFDAGGEEVYAVPGTVRIAAGGGALDGAAAG